MMVSLQHKSRRQCREIKRQSWLLKRTRLSVATRYERIKVGEAAGAVGDVQGELTGSKTTFTTITDELK